MDSHNTKLSEIKQNLIETFEQVKHLVHEHEHRSRAGLMLGLQELGTTLNGFIGAYYPVASNIIVINKTPLRRIQETKPSLFKPYIFHILLHEYIHSLGFLNEETTRQKTYAISKRFFGKEHIITQLSTNIEKYFPNLMYPLIGWKPSQQIPSIELVYGFDHSSSNFYVN